MSASDDLRDLKENRRRKRRNSLLLLLLAGLLVFAAAAAGLYYALRPVTLRMGVLLWLRDGYIHRLEGYSYGESTSGIDFERVAFGAVGQFDPTVPEG